MELEPVERPDGRDWYTDRGPFLRALPSGPDSGILCHRVQNTICETGLDLVGCADWDSQIRLAANA